LRSINVADSTDRWCVLPLSAACATVPVEVSSCASSSFRVCKLLIHSATVLDLVLLLRVVVSGGASCRRLQVPVPSSSSRLCKHRHFHSPYLILQYYGILRIGRLAYLWMPAFLRRQKGTRQLGYAGGLDTSSASIPQRAWNGDARRSAVPAPPLLLTRRGRHGGGTRRIGRRRCVPALASGCTSDSSTPSSEHVRHTGAGAAETDRSRRIYAAHPNGIGRRIRFGGRSRMSVLAHACLLPTRYIW
jgi:hypothetical protein